jgi:CspA family cold shock protein
MKGKVRWFNNRKGYGFVSRDDGGRDLFVHWTGIEKDGYKTLKAKQAVEYELVKGPKGDQAGKVKVLKDEPQEEQEVQEDDIQAEAENQ